MTSQTNEGDSNWKRLEALTLGDSWTCRLYPVFCAAENWKNELLERAGSPTSFAIHAVFSSSFAESLGFNDWKNSLRMPRVLGFLIKSTLRTFMKSKPFLRRSMTLKPNSRNSAP